MVIDDLAAKIISLGLATAIETDVFLGADTKIPSQPHNVGPYVSIIDTGGVVPLKSHGKRYPRPSFQIVVRAASATIARTKAHAIREGLGDLYNVTIDGSFYLEISAVQEVLDMQKDEANRRRFGFNINVLKTQ